MRRQYRTDAQIAKATLLTKYRRVIKDFIGHIDFEVQPWVPKQRLRQRNTETD